MDLKFDYEQSLLTNPTSGLSYFLYPRTIALIGATDREGSVGRTIMKNLLEGNRGNFIIFPVNPTRNEVMGVQAYKTVKEVPLAVELAVIVLPAKIVESSIEQCGVAGVKAAIIISAGFKEVGAEGAALEERIVQKALSYGMRVVGPNCLGVMTPKYGMNATFAARMALPGNVAFISQSGAMCTTALDWALHQKVGFSAFISIGSMADVQWSDMLNYLADDNNTAAILIYMETIGDGRDFMSAARAVTSRKPVVVIKAGKSEAAAVAAASHTGSLAGSHDSYLAAMRACGVLTVDSIRELFDVAVVVQKQPLPKGNRLTIVTNAGGPGVLATDAVSVTGGEVAKLDEETIKQLDAILPSAWSHGNPVDILGDADAELYSKTMEIALKDQNSDGVLIILSPQSVTEPLATAVAVVNVVKKLKEEGKLNKPVICSWMGGVDVQDGFRYLNENGVPCIDSPDDAAKVFSQLHTQHKYIQLANEQVCYKLEELVKEIDKEKVIAILKKAQDEGQEVLSEYDSKMVLKNYGIKITENVIAETREAAGKATEVTGFPCVVKLHSDTITHKSDVGGVMLRLPTKEAVEDAFDQIKANCIKHVGEEHFQGVTVQPMIDINAGIELLAGSLVDPQFGPLVVFGTGGCAVEIYQDTATAIPPLTPNTAMECINATKISVALHGTGTQRFPGVNMKKLVATMINFSSLLTEVTPYVTEMEINPLLALKDEIIALDARIMIRSKACEDPIPYPLIRPYPTQYKYSVTINNRPATIRLLNVFDADALTELLELTSPADWTSRFLNQSREQVMAEVVTMCNCDYDTTIPLAMFDDETKDLMGMCRGFRLRGDRKTMELKVLTSSKYRKIGVARSLIKHMKLVAKAEGIRNLVCVVTEDNNMAMKLLESEGMKKNPTFSNPAFKENRQFGNLTEYVIVL